MKKILTLYIWRGTEGLPSSSPYCLKVMYALKYKNLPFDTRFVGARMPEWATRGKLPIAEFDGKQVQDSTNILRELDKKNSEAPLLYPADPVTKADTILLEDWSDEAFTLNAVYYRWCVDRHFLPFSKQIFGGIPFPVRALVQGAMRKRIQSFMNDQGLGALPEEERLQRYRDSLWSLAQRLRKHPFVVGDHPTAADFSLLSSIEISLHAKLDELTRQIEASPEVMSWVGRMRALVS